MKAIQVTINKEKDEIEPFQEKGEEGWGEVCERFDGDVHRIRDVASHDPYTALYACYDDDNLPSYFLVEEDRQLDRIRHKVFLNKLGRN